MLYQDSIQKWMIIEGLYAPFYWAVRLANKMRHFLNRLPLKEYEKMGRQIELKRKNQRTFIRRIL